MGLGPLGHRGPAQRLQRRSSGLWRAMVEVGRSGAVRSMISRHKIQQNTDRIARTVLNVAVCRTFLRSVLATITARGDGFIARNPQIATAGRMGGSACFAGLFWTSTCSRSVRSVFYELLRRLCCSPELTTDGAGIGMTPMPAPYFRGDLIGIRGMTIRLVRHSAP
jgi:hypothetical protein